MVVARKRFGQNFLQDTNVIHQIVRALGLRPQDKVIEIGPGRGALTKVLLTQLHRLIVIEIDRDLFAQLAHFSDAHRLEAFCEDALKVDFSRFGSELRLIGNLPYNISTPLLFHLLSYRAHIDEMLFMLQAEVVDRILAQPGDEAFGRLSVMFQYYCQAERVLEVGPECFYPVPKVNSTVVSLRPKHEIEVISFESLEFIVAKAFSMRRKTLANNFKGIFANEDWVALDISSQKRAQSLCIKDFVKMAQYFESVLKLNTERANA